MSEVTEKPKSSSTLKKLTSGSTWVSPFRSGGERKNLHQQLKEENSISKINVPRKFASHPTLLAQKEKEKKKAEAAAKDEAETKIDAKPVDKSGTTDTSIKSLNEVPIDTPTNEDATEVNEGEEVTAEDAGAELAAEDEVEAENEDEVDANIADDAVDDDAADAEVDATADTTNATTEPETSEVSGRVATADEHVKENAEAAAEAAANIKLNNDSSDDIVAKVAAADEPIEIVTQPQFKYEPAEEVENKAIEALKDKPKLLDRYNELNTTALGSVSRTLDDPNKVIDLGSGLKMTQQQLLDIAAKRVAPVLANINDEVSKTRTEDEIKRQQDLSVKVAGHEKKLTADFDKHVKKVGKLKEKFNKEIDLKLTNLTRLMATLDTNAVTFEKNTRQEIETANTEFTEREAKAVEKHFTDKETLLKNHDELEATKKQELEDAKANQEKTTAEIEELQEKKSTLDDENSELSSRIDALTAEFDAKIKELESLKSSHSEKEEAISKNLTTKKELDNKLASTNEAVKLKQNKHNILSAEVGALAGVVGAYAAKLASVKSDNEKAPSRLAEAKDHFKAWEAEKQAEAKKVALEHERQRAEIKEAEESKRIKAQEEAETKRHEEELERQRLKEEEERKAEEDRIAAEKKAEDDRIAAEKKAEEDRIAAEKKIEDDRVAEENRKEEEAKAKALEEEEAAQLALQPEYQRAQRVKQRDEEKQRLVEEREEQERIYQERKQKEETEASALQREIDELNEQKNLKAQEARNEAERLAQAKLDEIERLKAEHDERLRLYQERLDFEELQKSRLLEEVENLKRIRELREEKARLSNEVNKGVLVEDIQKLIDERELEVTRLSKQIELDDHDLYVLYHKEPKKLSTLGPSPSLANQSSISPVAALDNKERASKIEPKKAETTPIERSSPSKSNKASSVAAGAALGTAAGVGAAGSGATISANRNPPSVVSGNGSEGKQRSGSITKLIKRLSQRFKSGGDTSPTKAEAKVASSAESPSKVSRASNPASTGTKATPPESINLNKQPAGVAKETSAASVADSSDYVYEEVSDGEYERNKNHPDYLEVSHDEYEKSQKAYAKAQEKLA